MLVGQRMRREQRDGKMVEQRMRREQSGDKMVERRTRREQHVGRLAEQRMRLENVSRQGLHGRLELQLYRKSIFNLCFAFKTLKIYRNW